MNFASGTSQQYSHTDNGVLGQRGTKQSMKALYDKNIYGPVGMKDMRFPVDQAIQAGCCTRSRRIARFTRIAPTGTHPWGSTPGLPTSNIQT